MDMLLRLSRHIDYSAQRYVQMDRAYAGNRGLDFLPQHVKEEVGDRLRPLTRTSAASSSMRSRSG